MPEGPIVMITGKERYGMTPFVLMSINPQGKGFEEEGRVICVWGGRHSLKINSGEVHECPLRSRSSDGTISLSDCKYCSSHIKIKGERKK